MDSARLEAIGEGRFKATGQLSFATAAGLLNDSKPMFEAADGQLDIDLSGVTHSDSAGLALLIEWIRLAAKRQRRLSYSNLPAQLLAIARMSNIDDLLFASEKAAQSAPVPSA